MHGVGIEMDTPQPAVQPPTAEPQKVPPFVQVVKTPGDCQVNHNLIDPWLAVALLDMGRQALIESMKKPELVKPTNGIAGMLSKMRR